MSYRTAAGRFVSVGSRLAAGGEGEVYAVTAPPDVVFKKYKPEILAKAPDTGPKVRAMTTSPPPGWKEAGTGHVTLAWPSQVVLENSRFAGFLMPKVDTASSVELHRIANPSDRRAASGNTSWMRGFTWNYLVRVAANLAQATHMLHTSGSVIGDFNERNILVTSQARVTLIDCDSMQFTAAGRPYVCRVGRPEFTPPELRRADWKTTVRQPSSDLFALAIHIYQLIMEGEHPFRGVWSGAGEKPSVPDLAERGTWAYRRGGNLGARPAAIGIDLLPDSIRELFKRAFEEGATSPSRRPTALDWFQALNSLAGSLRNCRTNKQHFYPQHHRSCPWCAHERRQATMTTTVNPVQRTTTQTAMPIPTVPSRAAPPSTGPRSTGPRPAAPPLTRPVVPAAAVTTVTDVGLNRTVGRSRLFMVSTGSIFGSGWLFAAGYAEQSAGPASLLAWIIGGAAALVLALVTAELSAVFPVAGGLARFPARAFGAVVGVSFGWLAWLQAAAVTAIEVVATGTLLNQWETGGWVAKLEQLGVGQYSAAGFGFTVLLAAAFTALNFSGISSATRVNSLLTWLKLGTIGFAAVALLTHFDTAGFAGGPHALLPAGPSGVLRAVGSGGIVFAYLGFEQAGHLAGEAQNPRRDIPWAVIAPVVIATIVYVALQTAFIGALPGSGLGSQLASGSVSIFDLARANGITPGQLNVLRAAPVLGVLGAAAAYSVTTPRLAYGLARAGLVPPGLAKTRRGVPWAAAAVTFAATVVLLLPGTTWQVIVGELTSASALMYAGAPLSLAAFRAQYPAQTRPYRLPAVGVLGPAAFAIANLIVYWSGWDVNWRVFTVLLVGSVVLLVTRRPTAHAVNFPAVAWLAAYLVGLGLISRLGQYYGGSATIPMWWDLIIVTIFSVAIYQWAARTRV
jgi:amino acid transporter